MISASWNPTAISTRFEALSNTVHEAYATKQLLDSRTKLQHAQMEQLLDRLTKLDPVAAQAVAREHLPKRKEGYIDFKRHRALAPYYRAIVVPGPAEAYAEVADHISESPDFNDPQRLKQLTVYAMQLQGVAKKLQA
jgi:hypothetical protein